MSVEADKIDESLKKLPFGKWLVLTLEIMAVVITLVEFYALVTKGMRFLGSYSTKPNVSFIFILTAAIIIWIISGYVLLKRSRGTTSDKTPERAYNKLPRMVASVTLITSIVLFLYLIFGIFRYDVVNAGEVKEDQLGIAVAEFGQGMDMSASPEGKELSAFIARNLRKRIDLLPGLKGNVTIMSAPLIRNVEQAEKIGKSSGVSLVIWGWISETEDDIFLPTFTFIEHIDIDVQLDEIPPWYDIEIQGDGSLELSQMFASKTSSLIEYIMGLIFLEQSQYPSALSKFQKAVELTEADANSAKDSEYINKSINRTLAIYHLAVGRTHAVMEHQDLAKSEYEIAISYDADYGPTYIGLGNIDYTDQRCREALSWYDLAVAKAPEKAASWYARGNANYCLGDYETALSDYQSALDVAKPNDKSLPLYHLVLGITLCNLERDEWGIQALSRAREISAPGSNIYTSAESEIKNCQAVPTEVIESPLPPTETIEPPLPATETQSLETPQTPSPTPRVTELTPVPTTATTPTLPSAELTPTPRFRRPGNKAQPSPLPTSFPTSFPTPFPTAFPTQLPTSFPTPFPTPFPTRFPNRPTQFPTPSPTAPASPTLEPISFPTEPPSSPTPEPESLPTTEPTQEPTKPPPTSEPTSLPSPAPTEIP